MFKFLFGSSGNKRGRKGGFFSRMFKSIKSIFRKQPKEITPTPTPQKLSVADKIKKSMRRNDENNKNTLEEVKKKARILKRKFKLSESQGKIIDQLIVDANKGSGADLRLANDLIDPNKLTKSRVKKLIKQYEEARKKKRGLSYMMTPSNLSVLPSKRKLRNLMENRSYISKNLTQILKKYKDF